MKAIWKGEILAESNETVEFDGNFYFPSTSLNKQYFQRSHTRSRCPFKGKAKYYNVRVQGKLNKDAAWYYPEPIIGAVIKNHVAFWKGVEIKK
jgi:uncharacterized protein (DUF427 family)